MKKSILFGFIVFCLLFSTISFSSCSRKSGCPVNEEVHTKLDKKGKPKRKPTSGLFKN